MRQCRHYLIRPVDSWFLRDGQPFEQQDEGMSEVRSVFPPFPPMVTGAFRAAVARAMGWDGRSPWNGRITAILGNGPQDPGVLRFGPPLVLRRRHADGRWEALFPAPRHLLRGKDDRPARLLSPGPVAMKTDAGDLPLPETAPGLKECEGRWLSAADMTRVLAGELPEAPVRGKELWGLEYRVGLQRHVGTRAAVPGMLYAVHHVRLAAGEPVPDGNGPTRRSEVAIGLQVTVEADDAAVPDPEPLGPLGGFRRLAVFERDASDREMPHEPEPPEDGRYVAILVNPARFDDLSWNRPGGEVPGLPGRLVFACTGRPVMIGGWDGRPGGGPVALRAHLPAGSVFFLEGDPEVVRGLFHDAGRRTVGCCTELGFGHVLLGHWPRQGKGDGGS